MTTTTMIATIARTYMVSSENCVLNLSFGSLKDPGAAPK